MKVVIYSDLQATESAEKLRSDPNMPLQRWRVTQFYSQLVRIMDKHDAVAVWDLGDTLDDRSEIPVQTIQSITDMVGIVCPQPHNSIKLVGNHEQHYKNAYVHSGGMFKNWFTVVDRPRVVTVDGVDVACMPFPAPDDDLDAIVNELHAQCRSPQKILLGHLDVQGAKYPSGESIISGLKSTHLSKFDLCLFGHVHKHQQLADNAWYVGSPFQQDFNERDQPKFVCILDLNTLKVEWEEVTGFPQYKYGTIEQLSHLLAGEDRIHIVLQNEADAAAYYAHPYHKDATVSYGYAASVSDEAAVANTAVVGTQDYYLAEWVKRHPIDGIDAEELLQIGKDLVAV